MSQYIFMVICVVLLAACAVQPTTVAQQKAVVTGPSDPNAKSFLLTQIVTQIPLGTRVQNIQYGWACLPGNSLDWRGGRINLTNEEVADSFRTEFTQANYKVAGDSKALFFDRTTKKAELLVAGAIEKVEINVCFPFSGVPSANVGLTGKIKGFTYMRVRWQVLNADLGEVVFETTTDGSFVAPEVVSGSVPEFLKNAFQSNLKNLLSEQRLHDLAKPSKDENKDVKKDSLI